MKTVIAQITDTHFGDPTALSRGIDPTANLDAVLKDAAGMGATRIIFTGDVAVGGDPAAVFSRLGAFDPEFDIVLGNHDEAHAIAPLYARHLPNTEGELYYAYDEGDYRYLFMDSSAGMIGGAQLNWLNGHMDCGKPVILYIHHPLVDIKTGMDRVYPLKNRDQVKQILRLLKKPVTVFCGHYPMPDARREYNITQFVTPAVSFQVEKGEPEVAIHARHFGYRLIEIEKGSIKSVLRINYGNGFESETEGAAG